MIVGLAILATLVIGGAYGAYRTLLFLVQDR